MTVYLKDLNTLGILFLRYILGENGENVRKPVALKQGKYIRIVVIGMVMACEHHGGLIRAEGGKAALIIVEYIVGFFGFNEKAAVKNISYLHIVSISHTEASVSDTCGK